MDDSIGFLSKYVEPGSSIAVMFEDDGRVGYAYLIDEDGHIRADVWLYNRCMTPEQPEWNDPQSLPFANSAEYSSRESVFKLPESENDVAIEWHAGEARILISGVLAGKLADGSKPGWAVNAQKDGPLAKALKA